MYGIEQIRTTMKEETATKIKTLDHNYASCTLQTHSLKKHVEEETPIVLPTKP